MRGLGGPPLPFLSNPTSAPKKLYFKRKTTAAFTKCLLGALLGAKVQTRHH